MIEIITVYIYRLSCPHCFPHVRGVCLGLTEYYWRGLQCYNCYPCCRDIVQVIWCPIWTVLSAPCIALGAMISCPFALVFDILCCWMPCYSIGEVEFYNPQFAEACCTCCFEKVATPQGNKINDVERGTRVRD